MENEIFIYGPIVHSSDPYAAEWGCVTLSDINDQLAAIPKDSENKNILVRINSEGGDVDTGFAIYSALRRKAAEGFTIQTRMDGIAASIATVTFLAGDERIGNEYIDPFVHNAWMFGMGDADEFQKTADELKKVNARLAKFYAEHTNLTEEQAAQYMKEETYLNADQLVELGFATKIEELLRPAALKKVLNTYQNKNKNHRPMPKENPSEEEKSFLQKFNALYNRMMPKAEKILQNETGEELVFADLEPNDAVEVGATATIDGQPASGTYTIPSLSSTMTFEDGAVTEIEAMDEEESDEVDVEAVAAENTQLKKELSDKKVEISAMKKEMNDFKKELKELKNLASGFSHEETPSNSGSDAKKTGGKAKARKMFKEEHYKD